VNPNSSSPAKVGVIRGPQGQKLDPDTYYLYLSDRLDYLLGQEDDPDQALADLLFALAQDELETPGNVELEKAGEQVICQNANLRQHLSRMNVPGESLPMIFPPNDPNAEEMSNETDLVESWVGKVLFNPYNPDR